MELNDFSSIFEMCVAFNLLYAFSDNFSSKIIILLDFDSTKIVKEISSKYAQLFVDKSYNYEDAIKRIHPLGKPKTTVKEDLIKFERYTENGGLEFGSKFKSLYFITGLLSILILLVSGSSHFFLSYRIHNMICVFSLICLLISLYVLISTFDKFGDIKRIEMHHALIVFMITLVISVLQYLKWFDTRNGIILPNKDREVLLCVFMVFLPFLLHIFRACCRKFRLEIAVYKVRKKYEIEINKIEDFKNIIEKQLELESLIKSAKEYLIKEPNIPDINSGNNSLT